MSILKLRVTSTPPAGADSTSVIGTNLSNQQVDENFLSLNERKLAKSGGTMTGFIVLHADPSSAMHPATKQSSELAAATAVAAHGVASAAHTASNVAVTPAGNIAATTVQAALAELDTEKLALAGGTLTGALTLAGAPTVPLHAATKAYVDSSVPVLAASGVTVTPAGSIAATNVQAALEELDNEKQAVIGYTPVNKNGDTMLGLLALSGDPSSAMHAVTKQYVDALGSGATRKNYVINGNFDVWQAGLDPVMLINTRVRTADCWWAQRNSAAGFTVTQVTGTLGPYALKMQRTAGNTATNSIKISQSIETSTALVFGKLAAPMVLSFYAKKGANYSGGNLSFYAQRGTAWDENVLDGYTGSLLLGTAGSAAVTSTLTRFWYTFTPDAPTTELGFRIEWFPTGTAGADDSVTIEKVKLEFGTTPTEYVDDLFSENLLRCKRYYQKSFRYYETPANNIGHSFGAMQWSALRAGSGAQGIWLFPLEVEMFGNGLTAEGFSPFSNDNGFYNENRSAGGGSWTMGVDPNRIAIKALSGSSSTVIGDVLSLHIVSRSTIF